MPSTNWERASVNARLRAQAGAEATRRRYAGAMTTKRSMERIIERRDISHRTACLCPDRRRDHQETRCPYL